VINFSDHGEGLEAQQGRGPSSGLYCAAIFGRVRLPGQDRRQWKRAKPELAAATDGMEDTISWGHGANRAGGIELWSRLLAAGGAAGGTSSGLAAV